MLSKKHAVSMFLSVALSLPLSVSAESVKHLVLNLVGTGTGYSKLVPDIDGDTLDDEAVCFDVDLFNQKTRRRIGTATDCLSNITTEGDAIKLVGTTSFHLAGGELRGELVTRGLTTVQPVIQPTVSANGQVFTHMTGAAGDGNAVLSGTGRYSSSTGTSRLSGLVNLADFPATATFDCLFVIDLD
ncbi:MAG: hypothetical protein U9R74_04740 [Pseudomonadota bacterium]|nr:hypothetical protein [Pseudomonadota bacterium]